MTPPPDLLPVAGIGLLLGFRHAFEPDHLAAVSTLATRNPRLAPALRLGAAWGLGHTLAVGVVVAAVMALRLRIPSGLEPAAELLVAVLLIALGLPVVLRYARGRWHMHVHRHEGSPPHIHLHSHARDSSHGHMHAAGDARRSLGFGLAHGLAGSAGVLVLIVAAAPTRATQLAYFLAFGAGTLCGMLLVSGTLAMLVRAAVQRGSRLATVIHLASAAASVCVGLWWAGATLSR